VITDGGAFHHEALFHRGEDELLAGTLPFIEEGMAGGEPVLVAAGDATIGLLRSKLNGRPDAVRFEDVSDVGRNPARLIPLWHEFVGTHAVAGRPVRGIAEPVCAGRGPAELVECAHHESLLNVAFVEAPEWRLMCAYDTELLAGPVIDAARRSHPLVVDAGEVRDNDDYVPPHEGQGMLDDPLPDPSVTPLEFGFSILELNEMRSFVYEDAKAAGLGPERTANLVLAASEVATNSVRHAGGHGTVRAWREPDALVCEVRDKGRIESPLVGRERPSPSQLEGRGLWLVNQLCDLVQIRSSASGNVVRLHMRMD
jgi:anti-sigma regulatory factor (Ser/Thr protein kinase)